GAGAPVGWELRPLEADDRPQRGLSRRAELRRAGARAQGRGAAGSATGGLREEVSERVPELAGPHACGTCLRRAGPLAVRARSDLGLTLTPRGGAPP